MFKFDADLILVKTTYNWHIGLGQEKTWYGLNEGFVCGHPIRNGPVKENDKRHRAKIQKIATVPLSDLTTESNIQQYNPYWNGTQICTRCWTKLKPLVLAYFINKYKYDPRKRKESFAPLDGPTVKSTITRMVIFLHPGQLSIKRVQPVVLTDSPFQYTKSRFEEILKEFKKCNAVCLYDGPPMKELTQ